MICDLLNLTSMPCTDPALYSNKQRQQKNEPNSQSEQLKRVSFFSFSFSFKEKKMFRDLFSIDYWSNREKLKPYKLIKYSHT